LANGGAPLGIGTLMVGGVSPLTNSDNVGWTGTYPQDIQASN
jgi:hypothetical protein